MSFEKKVWKASCSIFGVVALVCFFLEAIGLTAVWLQFVKLISAVNCFVSFVSVQICKDKEDKEREN